MSLRICYPRHRESFDIKFIRIDYFYDNIFNQNFNRDIQNNNVEFRFI